MTVSMYDIAVPGVINTLESMSAVLDKAAAHCEAKKIDQTVLTAYRLTPDMFGAELPGP